MRYLLLLLLISFAACGNCNDFNQKQDKDVWATIGDCTVWHLRNYNGCGSYKDTYTTICQDGTSTTSTEAPAR